MHGCACIPVDYFKITLEKTRKPMQAQLSAGGRKQNHPLIWVLAGIVSWARINNSV